MQVSQNRAARRPRRTRHRVKRPHFSHVTQTQYELVLEGHASTHEASISALRHNANSAFVTPFHYLADLFRRLRSQNGRRVTAVPSHPVCIILFDFRGGNRNRSERRKDGILGQKLCKVGNVVGGDGVKGWLGGGMLPSCCTAK